MIQKNNTGPSLSEWSAAGVWGGGLRTYVLDSARLLLPECLRETKEKHDLKGHRARTQTAALRFNWGIY